MLLVDGLEGMTLQLGRSDGALDAGEVTCYQTDRLLVAHHIPQPSVAMMMKRSSRFGLELVSPTLRHSTAGVAVTYGGVSRPRGGPRVEERPPGKKAS